MSAPTSEQLKEDGNACMGAGRYVDAMLRYTQAIRAAPRKDASLYSNRAFAFTRLGQAARALADADEAVRLRPSWPKGHFRRAEALSLANLHADALDAYRTASALDADDEHLRAMVVTATVRAAAQRRRARLIPAAGGAVGMALLALFILAPSAPDETPARRARAAGALSGVVGSALGLLFGAALGAAGGYAATLLQASARRGAALPPLETNDAFAARQVFGGGGGIGVGVAAKAAAGSHAASDASPPKFGSRDGPRAEDAEPAEKGPGGRRGRSTQHGRAAALNALHRRGRAPAPK